MGLDLGREKLISETYYTLRKKSVNKPTSNKLKLQSKKHTTIDISVAFAKYIRDQLKLEKTV